MVSTTISEQKTRIHILMRVSDKQLFRQVAQAKRQSLSQFAIQAMLKEAGAK